ncbi:MAG: hypothetical protein CME06_00855 [Gemmatimonadetes bacterium]|nr:hypothetical protein [Gemmatimonadota bacterium]
MLAIGFAALLSSCAGSEGKAREMADHAAFEEAQGNIPNATKLYQRVVEKYPDTEAAAEARARLSELSSETES